MLIARCAWHPVNFGRPRILAVSELCGSRRGGIYTDGICPDCLELLAARLAAQRVDAAQ